MPNFEDFSKRDMSFLLKQQSEWLRGVGPNSDIVVSSRVRLARNLEGYPFTNRASESELEALLARVATTLTEEFSPETTALFSVNNLTAVDKLFLLERQLISQEMIDSACPRAVLFDCDEQFSIMVNEEDHLRLQAITSGFDLKTAWKRLTKLDDQLSERLPYAFDEQLGYLTACPSNIGTGLRASVMLHLPALVLSSEVERVFRSFQKLNLTVRGIYGEGSAAEGELFQLSNQTSLGRTEEELLDRISEVVPLVIGYEQKARAHLLEKDRENLLDRCYRAMGILQTARTITCDEAMELLSSVRLGIATGLIDCYKLDVVSDLLLHIQIAHLEKRAGHPLTQDEENIYRATCLREKLVG
ncbi:MAG: protein arginine kinase [Planctomycetia bacterium]|nr:protein arginine kinase [Planctomycetia bacterium]